MRVVPERADVGQSGYYVAPHVGRVSWVDGLLRLAGALSWQDNRAGVRTAVERCHVFVAGVSAERAGRGVAVHSMLRRAP